MGYCMYVETWMIASLLSLVKAEENVDHKEDEN